MVAQVATPLPTPTPGLHWPRVPPPKRHVGETSRTRNARCISIWIHHHLHPDQVQPALWQPQPMEDLVVGPQQPLNHVHHRPSLHRGMGLPQSHLLGQSQRVYRQQHPLLNPGHRRINVSQRSFLRPLQSSRTHLPTVLDMLPLRYPPEPPLPLMPTRQRRS